MLRWMMGIGRIEKIKTEEIRARAGVANIRENIKAKIYEISSDTHQLHYIPLYHFTI